MHKCNVTARFILLVILFLLLPVTSNAEEIEIPLTVHEALRKEVSGIDRTGEHVTVGIPFPEGVLREKDDIPQLSLTGVDDYQFRTLAEWPDGSVKWALVDFQTDLLAGESNNDIKIVRGDGNSSKNYIARNKGDKIIVDTGIMDVEIRKKGFNLFDRVVIKGKEIVKREKSKGIVVTGGAGTEYLGSGSSSKVIIEENGPVRAVIKAEGTHLNGKMRMMDYTVRMYFYKNKSRVKVVYTLRNSSKKQFEHPFIRSLDLVTELSLQRPYEVNIAKHQGTVKDRLSGGNEKIYFYQAVSDFPQEFKGTSFYWHAPIPVDPER
ncbi:MAG: hypothetical protein KAJ10_10290, partial [Thermodesulfovibrionia bacterium]|nr:hypothetical protein [Thermodesulfovibrionia bacterium]